MKEPGELWAKFLGDSLLTEEVSKLCADIESAIRADEAAKVRAATIEECAERAEGKYIEDGLWSLNCERWEPESAYGQGRLDAAAAIRAKGAEHG